MSKINTAPTIAPNILQPLLKRCQYTFKHRDTLIQALTHPSYAAEQTPPPPDNQRLEFLGDAVLQLILSELLFAAQPEDKEGLLTRLRSTLAKESATASYARQLGLNQAMLLGRGEEMTGGRERPSILGDLFEAFLAAVYLDGGYEAAKKLCLALLPPLYEQKQQILTKDNPKGTLQELCQERFKCKPLYKVLSAEGPVHDPHFTISVSINSVVMGQGSGKSHRSAESQAAIQALAHIAREQSGEAL